MIIETFSYGHQKSICTDVMKIRVRSCFKEHKNTVCISNSLKVRRQRKDSHERIETNVLKML